MTGSPGPAGASGTAATARGVAGGAGDAGFPRLEYLHGFGDHHQTEAEPGALPRRQNSPQHAPLGL